MTELSRIALQKDPIDASAMRNLNEAQQAMKKAQGARSSQSLRDFVAEQIR